MRDDDHYFDIELNQPRREVHFVRHSEHYNNGNLVKATSQGKLL